MINDINLDKLYNELGNKEVVTRTEILACGFKEHDIKSLCVRGYIEKISHGKYRVIKSDNLLEEKFSRCLRLLESTSIEEAKKLFLEGYAADSKYMDKLFESILGYLEENNYSMVFRCFVLVFASGDDKYIRDVKFYLYLLNYITDIPERYRELVELLSFLDVEILESDDRYSDRREQKKIRIFAIENKRYGFWRDDNSTTIYDKIIKKLIEECQKCKRLFFKELDLYVKSKDYFKLVEVLTEREKLYGLDDNERLLLLVGQYIIDIRNNKTSFEISTKITVDWCKAIEFGNFNLAMHLLEQQGHTNYSIYLLLQELTFLLEQPKVEDKFKKCLELLENNAIEEAKKLFLECYIVDNKYLEKLFDFIHIHVINKNYPIVFRCFELVLASNDDAYIRDVKFYSYLLNYLTVIPDKFKDMIKGITYQDIKLSDDDKRYSSSKKMNEVRYSALIGEKCDINKKDHDNKMDMINYILWKRYCGKIVFSIRCLSRFIDNNDYKMLVESLNYESERRNLSAGLLLIKYLAQCILNIKNGIYPNVSNESAENEYDAVYIGNFKLAYQLREQRKLSNDEKSDEAGLKFLREIIKLLEQREKKEIDGKEKSISTITFDKIYDMLLTDSENGVNRAIEALPSYLQSIDKSKYEFLMVNLIRISKLDNDPIFYLPWFFSVQIQNDDFEFEVDFFVNKMKESLENKEIEIANIYLEILRDAAKKGSVVSIDILEQSLSITEVQIDKYNYGIGNITELKCEIEARGLSIEKACVQLGIDTETMNYIRLIYAKDYYSCGLDNIGDKLLNAVEKCKGKSDELKKALVEVRERRKFYGNQLPEVNLHVARILKP